MIPVTEDPMWYLTPAPLALGKWGGVTLQDPETVPPLLAVKMIPQAVTGPRGPQESGKGALSLGRALRETGVKYL